MPRHSPFLEHGCTALRRQTRRAGSRALRLGRRRAGLVDDVKRWLGRRLRLLIRRSAGLLRSTETHPPEGDELLGSRRSLFREVFKKRLAIAHIVGHARL